MKKVDEKIGALKRKLKIKGDYIPGMFISEMNKIKNNNKKDPKTNTKTRVSIMGLV